MGRKRERVDCIPWPPALDVAGTHSTRLAQAADRPIGAVAAGNAAVPSAVFRLGEAVRPPGARLRRAPVCGYLLHAVRAVGKKKKGELNWGKKFDDEFASRRSFFRSPSFLSPSKINKNTASRAEPAHKPLAPADFALPRPRKGTSAADAEAAAALEAAALEDSADDDEGDGGGFRARAAVLAAKEKEAAAAKFAAEEEEEAKRKAAAAASAAAAAGTGDEGGGEVAAEAAAPPPLPQEKEKAADEDDEKELVFELPSLEMPKDYARAAGGNDSENDGDEEEGGEKEGGEKPPPSSRPALDPLRWGIPNASFLPRSARFHPQPAPSGGGLTSAEVAVVRAARATRMSWADAASLVPGRSAPAVRKLYALATGESVGAGPGGAGGGSQYPRAGSRPHPSPFMLRGGGGAFVPGEGSRGKRTSSSSSSSRGSRSFVAPPARSSGPARRSLRSWRLSRRCSTPGGRTLSCCRRGSAEGTTTKAAETATLPLLPPSPRTPSPGPTAWKQLLVRSSSGPAPSRTPTTLRSSTTSIFRAKKLKI